MPTPDAGIAVLDAREYALIVTVDLDNVARVWSSKKVDRAEAARLLRLLADSFDAEAAAS